jgi:pimeloyl-ACP methyl ester carboxylesterase
MRKIIITFITCFLSIYGYGQANKPIALSTTAANRAIVVEKQGAGEPVLFLPGFTSPGSVWAETVKHLIVKKQSHLVSYAGFNGIAAIDTPWYPALRRELESYIRENKLKKLTIIGHSMGGNLAVDLAAALPEYVTRLVLVDAIPCMRDLMMPGVPASQIQYNNPYNKQLISMNDSAFRKSAIMMSSGMTSKKEGIDTLVSWMLASDRQTYVYGYTDLLKLDLRDALKDIKAETLILGASFPKPEITRQTFEKQYANLERKRIEIADNSKHFIMFDQPEWLYQQVNNFLGK